MNERKGRPWPTYLLGLAAIGAIVAAYLVVGPPSESTATATRTATAQQGVVQTTVSGSGNVEPVKQLDLGFKTSGVVSRIYVSQGEHVSKGQLLAELDPETAEVTLEQSRATLKTAEASLKQEEETDGEGSSSSSSASRASAASVDYSTIQEAPTAASAPPTGTQETTTSTTTSTNTSRSTTASGTPSGSGTITPAKRVETTRTEAERTSTQATGDSTLSSAARAANVASARAAVKSDKLAVQSDEEALANTKLYAPSTGTLVSLSGEVGETVSGTGTTKASTSSSSSSEGSSSTSSALSALGRSSSTSDKESGSSSSSSSSFAVLSDLSAMQLVVPLSESEVGEVKVGQPATIAIEALEGHKMAAEVTSISMLPTSDSGVVSYDVTFELTQLTEGLRPGMSATAEVVVKQAEGVNVPSSAITADTVTVLQSGKQVRKSVVTGLAGDSSTIVISGLNAGEVVVLPTSRSTSSSTSSLLTSRLGSRLSGSGLSGGLGGGAALRGGGAFPVFGGG